MTDHREKIKNIMREVCAKNTRWHELSPDAQETIIRRMERSCLIKVVEMCEKDFIACNWNQKKYVDRYSTECSRVVANLDAGGLVGSSYLLDQILAGAVDPKDVAGMENYDLCPQASQAERDAINVRKSQRVVKKFSDKHTCPKCKEKKAEYSQLMTMALDEAASMNFRCLVCDNTWIRNYR
jgi:DNA-directed RNA polymerase subunit M/transcription elongation factor TFIIS